LSNQTIGKSDNKDRESYLLSDGNGLLTFIGKRVPG